MYLDAIGGLVTDLKCSFEKGKGAVFQQCALIVHAAAPIRPTVKTNALVFRYAADIRHVVPQTGKPKLALS